MTARTIGPFVLERQIGSGGMGLVYSALYPEKDRRVAVKVLYEGLMTDKKVVQRFEREIEILKRLKHPNIVRYYGGGSDHNQRYYVMEYIDGGSLQEVLKKRTRLSWEQAIHVGRQVTSALEHAHNMGIIHRDLKPANLFLSTKGRLKLGDFGIARDTEATALTAAGKTVGTYAYMAPEQIQAGFPISRKTDLYALGCLLYEVLVGETPFTSDNPMDMLMQHLQDEPYSVCEKVPDCPVLLDRLIERLLAKNPDDRPYDALAVHTELGEIREKALAGACLSLPNPATVSPGQATSAKKPTDAPKKKRKKKKKRKDVPIHEQTWFLAACLILLLSATVWLSWPHGEDWYAEKWRQAMKEDEWAQRQSLEKHIDVYLEEFAGGEDGRSGRYVDEARDLSETLHANILEATLKNLARQDRVIEPPFKAACVKAAKLEDEAGLTYVPTWETPPSGDLPSNPLPTLERWKSLLKQAETLEDKTDEVRWLIRLCRMHHDYFREQLIKSPQGRDFVRQRMEDAEALMADNSGDQNQAFAIWLYCYEELRPVSRFEDFGEYARLRHGGSDAFLPEAVQSRPGEVSEEPEDSDGT